MYIICIHMPIYMCKNEASVLPWRYIYRYMYIYMEREREREKLQIGTCMIIYIYIIYVSIILSSWTYVRPSTTRIHISIYTHVHTCIHVYECSLYTTTHIIYVWTSTYYWINWKLAQWKVTCQAGSPLTTGQVWDVRAEQHLQVQELSLAQNNST